MTTYAIDANRGVNLLVECGEFFGFLGSDGADETIETLIHPFGADRWTIEVNGYDAVTELHRVRAPIGYVAQGTSVDAELTARENLRFACGACEVPRSERPDRIDELLEHAELTDVAGAITIIAICIDFSARFTASSSVLAVVLATSADGQ